MNLKESEDGYNVRLRSGFQSEFFRGDSYETYEQHRDKNHSKSINVRNMDQSTEWTMLFDGL